MIVNVNGIYYVHVCEQARWARSAWNSAIENWCIINIIIQKSERERGPERSCMRKRTGINWCMAEWCTQNVRRDSSSFTWHQPYNNHPWILIIRAIKGYSHSFRITCDICAVSLLESREMSCVRAMNMNKNISELRSCVKVEVDVLGSRP